MKQDKASRTKQQKFQLKTGLTGLVGRFTTLRWRLTLLNAALLTVLGIGLGIFIYFRVESYLYDGLRTRMQDYAVIQITNTPTSTRNGGKLGGGEGGNGDGDNRGGGGVGNGSSRNLEANSLSELAKLLAMRPNGEIHPVLLDSSGQIVTVTGTTSIVPFGAELPTAQQLSQAASSGGIFYITTSGSNGGPQEQLQVYLSVVENTGTGNSKGNQSDAPVGYVMLVGSLKPATDILNEIEFLLISGLSALIILTILSGYPLTQLGLRPLKKISGIARQLRLSRLDQRVPMPNSLLSATSKTAQQDEIWQLVLEFNAMLEKLEKAFLIQQQNEAQMRQFVSDASHELRTPLTILGGYLAVLQMGALDDPTQTTRIISTLQQEIDRLSRVVIDLLHLTKLDAKERSAEKVSPLDLGELVNRTLGNMQILAGRKEVKLEFQAKEEGIWVNGNADELYRVIFNLLDNAVRYSNPGGKVELSQGIEHREGKDWARIEVRDNGCGIASDQLDLIFNRFFRADKSRTRGTGNSGLGLAISKGIVESHQGVISVESKLGEGTCFIIRLPLLGVELETDLQAELITV